MKKIILRLNQFRKSDLFQTSFWNGIATIIKMGTGLISNKIVAVYLGPSGIALLGQFTNFTTMANSFAGMGINTGVTKYLAQYRTDEEEQKRILSTSLKLVLLGTFIVAIIVLFGANYFGQTILQTQTYNSLFYVFSLTLILFTLNGFFIAVLNGYKEFKKIIYVNVITSFFGLAIAVILVIQYGIYGALIGIILSTSLIAFITISFVLKSNWFKKNNFFQKFNFNSLKKLLQYTLMAFTSIFAVTYIQLLIRTHIIETLSMVEAGYWQGVVKISDIYLSVITTTLGIYYLPRLSEIKHNRELRREIFKGYKFLMPLAIVSSLFIFLFREIIIDILFSNSFKPMSRLFLFQMLGNVFKMSSWLLAYLMLAKSMVKTYILTELLFGLFYYLGVIFGIQYFSLIGVPIAYCITYFLYLISMLFIFRNIIFEKDNKI